MYTWRVWKQIVIVFCSFTAGVPNAPFVGVNEGILFWEVPRDNGQPILGYWVMFE